MRTPLFLAAVLALAGCGVRDEGPLRAVVIADGLGIVDPSLRAVDAGDAVLMGAAAQSLVRLDAAGQIVPGLAERWSVSDDGLSYIFRLGTRRWPDGSEVSAGFVVRRLRAAAAPRSRNPLAPILTGIEEIVATTDEVLEIRLTAPRPNLLQHLARPELAIVRDGAGAGPFRAAREADGRVRLARTVPDGEEEREDVVMLRAAGPAFAVTLFAQRQADVVLGGTWGDWPLVQVADPPAAALRVDPAAGLLGLAVVDTGGLLASAETRRALSMAIDRDALVAAMAVPGLEPRVTLAPTGLSNLAIPASPYWSGATQDQRVAEARRLVALQGAETVRVRVAMPDAPGYRLLFAYLKRDWAAIGVTAERVDMPRSADLRLVDAVAPSRGASWYFERYACARSPACDPEADAALASARTAANAAERAAFFGQADRRLTDAAVFIPLAEPLRWSLVARRVTGFRSNPFAVHSLADLLSESD